MSGSSAGSSCSRKTSRRLRPPSNGEGNTTEWPLPRLPQHRDDCLTTSGRCSDCSGRSAFRLLSPLRPAGITARIGHSLADNRRPDRRVEQ